MHEISCEICLDLMPLVHDGIASEDSCKAVKQHIEQCEYCKALFQGELPKESDMDLAFKKIHKQLQAFAILVLLAGILFGLSLTVGSGVFYNCLIMPVIGAIGYYVFRWKAVYFVPCLLFVLHFVPSFLGLMDGVPPFSLIAITSVFFWTCIYSVFAAIGMVIVGLLHFAFKKEK